MKLMTCTLNSIVFILIFCVFYECAACHGRDLKVKYFTCKRLKQLVLSGLATDMVNIDQNSLEYNLSFSHIKRCETLQRGSLTTN